MNEPGVPSPVAASSSVTPPPGPLTFGQILDRIFQIVRANLGTFLGIASLPAGLMVAFYLVMIAAVFSIANPWHPPNAAEITSKAVVAGAAVLAFSVLLYLVFALYEPAAIYAALQANGGGKVSFRQAYAVALDKAARYVWLAILRCLIVAGPILLFAAIVGGCVALVFMKGHGNLHPETQFLLVPLTMLVYAGSIIYSILAVLWLVLACPACVAENLPARAAIGRSFKLTRGGRGRIFLLLLVLYAIGYAAGLVIECVFLVLGSAGALVMMLLHVPLQPWGLVGIGVGGFCLLVAMFLIAACIWSAFATAFAVIYQDQRLRKEGVAGAAPAPAQAT